MSGILGRRSTGVREGLTVVAGVTLTAIDVAKNFTAVLVSGIDQRWGAGGPLGLTLPLLGQRASRRYAIRTMGGKRVARYGLWATLTALFSGSERVRGRVDRVRAGLSFMDVHRNRLQKDAASDSRGSMTVAGHSNAISIGKSERHKSRCNKRGSLSR